MSKELDEQCMRVFRILPGEWVKFIKISGGAGTYVRDWSPSTIADDARDLENEIERRGLVAAYIHALVAILKAEHGGVMSSWYLIRATPEQRARAFLEVVKP